MHIVNANYFDPVRLQLRLWSSETIPFGLKIVQWTVNSQNQLGSALSGVGSVFFYGEFDPGSGRTLAACLTHASRTMMPSLLGGLVANG